MSRSDSSPASARGRFVLMAQLGILVGFLGFAVTIIGWVVHLVRLSVDLVDTPSASMAISLVAIPIFMALAGIVAYVILGLSLDPEAREAPNEQETDG